MVIRGGGAVGVGLEKKYKINEL
jgi:hypothetical protein